MPDPELEQEKRTVQIERQKRIKIRKPISRFQPGLINVQLRAIKVQKHHIRAPQISQKNKQNSIKKGRKNKNKKKNVRD